jgi:hypothetical protein
MASEKLKDQPTNFVSFRLFCSICSGVNPMLARGVSAPVPSRHPKEGEVPLSLTEAALQHYDEQFQQEQQPQQMMRRRRIRDPAISLQLSRRQPPQQPVATTMSHAVVPQQSFPVDEMGRPMYMDTAVPASSSVAAHSAVPPGISRFQRHEQQLQEQEMFYSSYNYDMTAPPAAPAGIPRFQRHRQQRVHEHETNSVAFDNTTPFFNPTKIHNSTAFGTHGNSISRFQQRPYEHESNVGSICYSFNRHPPHSVVHIDNQMPTYHVPSQIYCGPSNANHASEAFGFDPNDDLPTGFYSNEPTRQGGWPLHESTNMMPQGISHFSFQKHDNVHDTTSMVNSPPPFESWSLSPNNMRPYWQQSPTPFGGSGHLVQSTQRQHGLVPSDETTSRQVHGFGKFGLESRDDTEAFGQMSTTPTQERFKSNPFGGFAFPEAKSAASFGRLRETPSTSLPPSFAGEKRQNRPLDVDSRQSDSNPFDSYAFHDEQSIAPFGRLQETTSTSLPPSFSGGKRQNLDADTTRTSRQRLNEDYYIAKMDQCEARNEVPLRGIARFQKLPPEQSPTGTHQENPTKLNDSDAIKQNSPPDAPSRAHEEDSRQSHSPVLDPRLLVEPDGQISNDHEHAHEKADVSIPSHQPSEDQEAKVTSYSAAATQVDTGRSQHQKYGNQETILDEAVDQRSATTSEGSDTSTSESSSSSESEQTSSGTCPGAESLQQQFQMQPIKPVQPTDATGVPSHQRNDDTGDHSDDGGSQQTSPPRIRFFDYGVEVDFHGVPLAIPNSPVAAARSDNILLATQQIAVWRHKKHSPGSSTISSQASLAEVLKASAGNSIWEVL